MAISQTSTKTTQYTTVHFQSQVAIQHFSGENRDKNTAQNSQKHAISSERKFSFLWKGLWRLPAGRSTTFLPNLSPPTKPSGSDKFDNTFPEFQPNQYHCIHRRTHALWRTSGPWESASLISVNFVYLIYVGAAVFNEKLAPHQQIAIVDFKRVRRFVSTVID